MKNKILNISETRFEIIKSKINPNDTFLVELDGKEIQNKTQLFDIMEKEYDLHTSDGTWDRNWDALDDLMEDLDWIPQQKHILAVHSFSNMFSQDKKSKEIFFDGLKMYLEFWEKDVLHCVVEGKTKEFTVSVFSGELVK